MLAANGFTNVQVCPTMRMMSTVAMPARPRSAVRRWVNSSVPRPDHHQRMAGQRSKNPRPKGGALGKGLYKRPRCRPALSFAPRSRALSGVARFQIHASQLSMNQSKHPQPDNWRKQLARKLFSGIALSLTPFTERGFRRSPLKRWRWWRRNELPAHAEQQGNFSFYFS